MGSNPNFATSYSYGFDKLQMSMNLFLHCKMEIIISTLESYCKDENEVI